MVQRSVTGDGTKSAIFSKMGEPRLNSILDLNKHSTCLATPAPNAYNVADSNLESQKKLKFSANFMAQERPANVFDMQNRHEQDRPGPGSYEVEKKESAVDRQFSLR